MSWTHAATTATAHALLVVDMQRAFVVGDEAVPDARRVQAAVECQLASARAAGCLVVHLQNDGEPGAPDEPESEGWRLATDVLPGEHVVRKRHDDGFDGTDLETILRQASASTVSVCGVMSEMCVAATARGALHRHLGVVVAHDAHATYDVPEQGPLAPAVPARLASRAAEWALGDEPVFVDHSSQVRFAPQE